MINFRLKLKIIFGNYNVITILKMVINIRLQIPKIILIYFLQNILK